MPDMIFDIETGALPPDQIERFFNVASVKTGNLGPEKAQAKIEAAREEFLGRAALNPATGCVVAIGLLETAGGDAWVVAKDSEPETLAGFWGVWATGCYGSWIGHNIHGFDLPFLVRRSWICDVTVPSSVMERRRYWHPSFVDTMQVWGCGDNRSFVKLDDLARLFGVGGKPDDVSGADFARLWWAGEGTEEREKAREYLENDLRMTLGVATAMGLC